MVRSQQFCPMHQPGCAPVKPIDLCPLALAEHSVGLWAVAPGVHVSRCKLGEGQGKDKAGKNFPHQVSRVRGWESDARLFQKLMSIFKPGHCCSSHCWGAMQRSEQPGHAWHRAAVPLAREVFLVPSSAAVLCLLPDHVCGRLRLVGRGGCGMAWSGHPRKHFQCSARLHGLKTANHICSLAFIRVLFIHIHRSIFLFFVL